MRDRTIKTGIGNPETMSNSKLDSIMEAVNAAVLTIDRHGTVVECNDATCRLFGYEKSALVGNNVKMLMPDPDRSGHDQYIHNHLSTGVNRIIGTGRKVRGLHQSGKLIPLHLSVARFSEEEEIFFTGILHDLTELDEALSISQRLGQIVEESINEIYTFNGQTLAFTSANRAALSNLQYTHSELEKLTPAQLTADIDEPELREILAPLLARSSERINLNTRFRRKDNTFYEAEVTLHYSSVLNPPEVVAIAQDVTEKLRLVRSIHRNQRMESIGNLTGGIAHDFNNILTVVMGNLDLLHDEISEPSNLELLDDARDAADMGARLTKRLLTFARRSPLTPNRTNINRLIADLTDMLKRTLGSNIQLESILNDELWDATIDVSELENALVNLAINARDAMPDGGRLIIETANTSLDDENILGRDLQPGDYVRISVTDTGTGIPDDIKDSIFEPFVTSKKGGKGSGLGLSMVYGFVSQSGGCISVYSEVGQGTVFSLYLPRSQTAVADEDMPQLADEPQATAQKTILVAEDDDRVRNLTVKRLAKLGHKVLEAANGYVALDLYRENPDVDLVFSDVVMTQGMTGYDLAVAIREINENTPILLTSGYAEDIVNAEKLEASGLSLLRKPYHQSELEETLNQLFGAS